MISDTITKYSWSNKYEKTMDFKNYESSVTYESQNFGKFNDSWKSFDDKIINKPSTVGEFRISMSLTAKNINNHIIEKILMNNVS
jgi:hypothetical protein